MLIIENKKYFKLIHMPSQFITFFPLIKVPLRIDKLWLSKIAFYKEENVNILAFAFLKF